jgi:uncharacterized SAM-binding protein YcdF (DUF218 family)
MNAPGSRAAKLESFRLKLTPPVFPRKLRAMPKQGLKLGWKIFRWSCVVVLVTALAAGLLLLFPHQVLTRDDGSVRGDVLVVLGGGEHADRARHAAELYRAGVAPWVLCSGRGDCASNEAALRQGGVPASAILTEDQSRTTSENARFSLPILRRLGAKRVIIVTSWYHSGRAWHVFHHYDPDLELYSCPSYEHGLRHNILYEYLKVPGYFVRYGVNPI